MREFSILKKFSLSCIFLFSITLNLFAQEITGLVKDSETGLPLSKAAVLVLKTGNGTETDESGKYRIGNLKEGKYSIEVRYVGYSSVRKQVTVGKNQNMVVDFNLTPQVFNQEQVVVTATKISTNRDNAPMNVSVITKTEIEQSSESNILPVISSNVPGLFVTERGVTGFGLSDGSAGKISIRGVGGGESSFPVLLLIDGQPQFMGIFGHPIPDSYISSDIEKVEVIKGPASVLYGTSAMGGVINLISRKQAEPGFSLDARAMYGSFDTRKYAASTGFRSDGFSVTASYNHDQTDGQRANSDFKIDNGFFKIGYEINPHFSLTANANHSVFEAIDPGSIYYATPGDYDQKKHWVDITRTNSYFTLSNKFEKTEGAIKAYYSYGNHDLYSGWKSIDENIGLSVFQGLNLFDNNQISIGLDLKKYGGRGNSTSLGTLDGKWVSVNETGVYLIAQQKFFNKLILNSGIRLENHTLFGNEWVPQFGAVYEVSGATTLKASVSKGFRSPTIRELYLFPAANAGLKPETMWNYESTWSQNLLKNKIRTELTVFLAKGDNLIMSVSNPTPPPAYTNQNSGSFEHKGFELSVDYKATQNLSFNSGYSFLKMDSPKVSAPKHQLSVKSNLTLGSFDFYVQMLYIGGLYTSISPVAEQNYTLLNSKATYRVNKHLSLFLSGENLAGSDYQLQYGYPMPGATVFAGLQVRL